MKKLLVLAMLTASLPTLLPAQKKPLPPYWLFHGKVHMLDTTIQQHGCTFSFWRTGKESSYLLIVRHRGGKDSIIFDEYIRDGYYQLTDENGDGFIDFVPQWRGEDHVCCFDPVQNVFLEARMLSPHIKGVIDKAKHVKWGFTRAMYSAKYDCTTLFQYKGTHIYILAEIEFITREEYDGKEKAIKLVLHRYKPDGKNDQWLYSKTLRVKNARYFDYVKYWKEHFREYL